MLSSGLGATLGVATEVNYGEAVATGLRGFEFDSSTLKADKQTRQGKGMRGGRLLPNNNRRVVVARQAGGDIEMDLATRGLGIWLRPCLGASAIAQIGASTAFEQLHTLGDLRSRSLTIQLGVPDGNGNLHPFTYPGAKVTDWEIGVDDRDIAKLKMSIDARDEDTVIAYSAPDYTQSDAAHVLHFAGAELLVAGDTVLDNLRFTVKGTNGLKTDRFKTGAAGLKDEPVDNDWRQVTVEGDEEFLDMATWVNRHYTDEAFALIARFTGQSLGSGNSELLEVQLPTCRLNEANPTVEGPDMVEHGVTIEALDSGAGTPVTVRYVSLDTAI